MVELGCNDHHNPATGAANRCECVRASVCPLAGVCVRADERGVTRGHVGERIRHTKVTCRVQCVPCTLFVFLTATMGVRRPIGVCHHFLAFADNTVHARERLVALRGAWAKASVGQRTCACREWAFCFFANEGCCCGTLDPTQLNCSLECIVGGWGGSWQSARKERHHGGWPSFLARRGAR